jgi:hypothetical protein
VNRALLSARKLVFVEADAAVRRMELYWDGVGWVVVVVVVVGGGGGGFVTMGSLVTIVAQAVRIAFA